MPKCIALPMGALPILCRPMATSCVYIDALAELPVQRARRGRSSAHERPHPPGVPPPPPERRRRGVERQAEPQAPSRAALAQRRGSRRRVRAHPATPQLRVNHRSDACARTVSGPRNTGPWQRRLRSGRFSWSCVSIRALSRLHEELLFWFLRPSWRARLLRGVGCAEGKPCRAPYRMGGIAEGINSGMRPRDGSSSFGKSPECGSTPSGCRSHVGSLRSITLVVAIRARGRIARSAPDDLQVRLVLWAGVRVELPAARRGLGHAGCAGHGHRMLQQADASAPHHVSKPRRPQSGAGRARTQARLRRDRWRLGVLEGWRWIRLQWLLPRARQSAS